MTECIQIKEHIFRDEGTNIQNIFFAHWYYTELKFKLRTYSLEKRKSLVVRWKFQSLLSTLISSTHLFQKFRLSAEMVLIQ